MSESNVGDYVQEEVEKTLSEAKNTQDVTKYNADNKTSNGTSNDTKDNSAIIYIMIIAGLAVVIVAVAIIFKIKSKQ